MFTRGNKSRRIEPLGIAGYKTNLVGFYASSIGTNIRTCNRSAPKKKQISWRLVFIC